MLHFTALLLWFDSAVRKLVKGVGSPFPESQFKTSTDSVSNHSKNPSLTFPLPACMLSVELNQVIMARVRYGSGILHTQ